jgi:hypothetical protein
MAGYRIVCVRTEHPHRHVVAVGTGDEPGVADWRWPLDEVRRALAAGDSFYTVSPTTGRCAGVRIDRCKAAGCAARTIRSAQDAVEDNQLESLPPCTEPRVDDRAPGRPSSRTLREHRGRPAEMKVQVL